MFLYVLGDCVNLDYKKHRAWAENLSIVMQIGLTMAGCVGFCFFIGLTLDRWLGIRGLVYGDIYSFWGSPAEQMSSIVRLWISSSQKSKVLC